MAKKSTAPKTPEEAVELAPMRIILWEQKLLVANAELALARAELAIAESKLKEMSAASVV